MAKKTDETEVTGPRLPAADHRNHCLICGGVADHVHSSQPEKRAPRPKREKPAEDPAGEDDVMVVELDPELVAAMSEAGEVELSVEFDGSGRALPEYDPENPERTWEPQEGGDYPPEPVPEPEPNRTVTTKRGPRARK